LEAPYLNRRAAAWLSEQPIKAVGFDFPQDYVIREIPERHPSAAEMPSHDLILRKGILLIEYLCNLHRIQAKRVELYALPLKVAGAEGACARVVAVEN
jgi:kynurenine formamidase